MAIYEPVVDTGVIVVDTSEIKTDLQATYRSAFGESLQLGDETPQGVLISGETAERTAAVSAVANVANQLNPNLAGGVYLDAIMALTGLTRAVATASTFATAPTVTGIVGTLIPAGSRAQNSAGDLFETTADVTLTGTDTVPVISVELGAIPCTIGDLSIVSNIVGWETVNNTVAATVGTPAASDVLARTTRNNALSLQGTGSRESIISSVTAVENVFSVVSRDNNQPTTQVVDGVSLDPNSVWVCVSGGDSTTIAERLNTSKNIGCQWQNGKSSDPISIELTDPYNGQTVDILFDRPDDVPVSYQLTVLSNGVTNVSSVVKNAILAYAAGEIDGLGSLGVGVDVSPFTATSAVNAIEPQINVLTCEVTKNAVVDFQPETIPIELYEIASTAEAFITVVVDP